MENVAQTLLARIARLLEVESVAPATDFRAGPLWDSLTAFALRVLIGQVRARPMSATELESCRTVAELLRAAEVTA